MTGTRPTTKGLCALCDCRAETHAPFPMCRAHATDYYQGLLNVAIGRRLARSRPDLVKAEEELANIYTMRNFLASRKKPNPTRWPWKRVKPA